MPTLQETRRENLLRLLEGAVPANLQELLDLDEIPGVALWESGPNDDYVSLHQTVPAALAYMGSDDSDYTPKRLIMLDSGERREVVQRVSYELAASPEQGHESPGL